MSEVLRDMWPPIATKVLSPLSILQFQADQLREKSQGVFEGAVRTWKAKDGDVVHDFQIIAPLLNRYTYMLFQTWHKPEFVYPATLRFEPWVVEWKQKHDRSLQFRMADQEDSSAGLRTVSTSDEYLDVLSELLGSSHTKAVLSSLISRINDLEAPGQSAQAPAEAAVPAANGG
jgi:hypothetical protein